MVTIYLIRDPITKSVVYVGRTINITSRICQHNSYSHSRLIREFVSKLKAESLKPLYETIEEVSDKLATEKENYWIAVHSSIGNLLNLPYGVKKKPKKDKTGLIKVYLKLDIDVIYKLNIQAAHKGKKLKPYIEEHLTKLANKKAG